HKPKEHCGPREKGWHYRPHAVENQTTTQHPLPKSRLRRWMGMVLTPTFGGSVMTPHAGQGCHEGCHVAIFDKTTVSDCKTQIGNLRGYLRIYKGLNSLPLVAIFGGNLRCGNLRRLPRVFYLRGIGNLRRAPSEILRVLTLRTHPTPEFHTGDNP